MSDLIDLLAEALCGGNGFCEECSDNAQVAMNFLNNRNWIETDKVVLESIYQKAVARMRSEVYGSKEIPEPVLSSIRTAVLDSALAFVARTGLIYKSFSDPEMVASLREDT